MLAAAAGADTKLRLQINLAGIIPQTDGRSEENNRAGSEGASSSSPAGASGPPAGHLEAVW